MRLCAIATLLGLAGSAHADGVPLPTRAAGFELALGHAGTVEHLHFKQRFELGLFVRIDRWEAIVDAGVMAVDSGLPARDSSHLTDLSIGGRLMYRVPLGAWNAIVGVGMADHAMSGSGDVTLTCRETGTCVAGYYRSQPSYRSWVPQLRGGLAIDDRSGSSLRSIALEVIVERWDLSGVPSHGLSGFAVLGGIAGTFGRGWGFPQ